MATTQQKREWWADWRCNPLKMKTVAFPGPDRDWNLPAADAAVPAFQLFASLMRRHNYLFREVSGGTYNCRKIAGTDSWSLHAYGIAIDLNPSVNKFQTTQHDYPQGFIDDVLATGLFKWLHTFDPMHWEIDVPPAHIMEEEDMPSIEEIRQVIREESAGAVWAPGKDENGNYYYLIDGKHPNTILRDIRKRVIAISAAGGASAGAIVTEIANRLAG